MVAAILVLVFVFGEPAAQAQALGRSTTPAVIPQDLQQVPNALGIMQTLNAVAEPQACDASGRPVAAAAPTLPEDPDLRFASLPAPSYSRAACSSFNVVDFCRTLSDAENIWAFDTRLEERRQSNEELRQRIYSHLNKYFQGLVTDPEILTACCGPAEPQARCGDRCPQNLSCQRRLSQTRLRIVPATSSNDQTVTYQALSHQIEFSESYVINSLQPETIEHMVLHEFGHACQFSRQRHLDETTNIIYSEVWCDNDTNAWADMQQLLPEVARCLRAPLVQESLTWRGLDGERACRNQWAKEAFADAIFAFRRANPRHWSWPCISITDSSHGPTQLIMSCVIPRALANTDRPRPRLWDQYCNRAERHSP